MYSKNLKDQTMFGGSIYLTTPMIKIKDLKTYKNFLNDPKGSL